MKLPKWCSATICRIYKNPEKTYLGCEGCPYNTKEAKIVKTNK